jgi:hypothetical protein
LLNISVQGVFTPQFSSHGVLIQHRVIKLRLLQTWVACCCMSVQHDNHLLCTSIDLSLVMLFHIFWTKEIVFCYIIIYLAITSNLFRGKFEDYFLIFNVGSFVQAEIHTIKFRHKKCFLELSTSICYPESIAIICKKINLQHLKKSSKRTTQNDLRFFILSLKVLKERNKDSYN